MTCFAKLALIEDLYIAHKDEFSVTFIYVRYVHLTKAKPIHTRQIHPLIREGVTLGLRLHGFSYKKKVSGRDPQRAWRDGKPLVVR
jgi:hypothetical protein